MNPLWKIFLLSEQATIESDGRIVFPVQPSGSGEHIYPISHLGILSVTGQDAALLLQGQVTCNVYEVTEHKAIFAAMCNPKGRVISTFLVLKKDDGFLLVLPKVLLEPVKKKLQMYVLRSKVTLTDSSDSLCLIGLLGQGTPQAAQFGSHRHEGAIFVSMSAVQNRQLIVADPDSATALWSDAVLRQAFQAGNSDAWRSLDILSGIPWLGMETSEEHIPQMLNLDKLNGISFNKGCYTGQEIVARTHYLGKAKRALFVAQCDSASVPAANAPVFDDNIDNTQAVGSVLSAQSDLRSCKLLLVLNLTETGTAKLTLADQTQLTLLGDF
jgi:tRNA-modifying protein YgfZ